FEPSTTHHTYFPSLAFAGLFCIRTTPGAYQPQSLSGGAYGVVSVTFSVGRSLPGVGSPTQRNVTMFGIFGKKSPQSGNGN
ncbi:hypothetical protein D1I79_RS26520, partial [Escherichia coli]